MKNCELTDLRATLERMNKAWKLLTMRKGFPAIGWLKSVEVTRGEDGTAHPHLHCLLIVKPSYFTKGYLSHATWTALWKDCLKIEYPPIVNVKVVKDNKNNDNKVPEEVLQRQVGTSGTQVHPSIINALLETLKYSVKPSDLEAEADWLIELTKQMHKTRAIGLGGILKQYLSEKEPEDLIHDEDNEEAEVLEEECKIIFDWAEVARRYAKAR
jgi:plasmid rolling circle replication initiator protein Rep